AALCDGRSWLDPIEVTRLLGAYGIPITPAVHAGGADAAGSAPQPVLSKGQPGVLKNQSPDITHKSDVGGVLLNLTNERAVYDAAHEILQRARAQRPAARIVGITVHPMILRPHARQLIAGIADDPTFGPVVVFGRGGTAVEIIDDKALALP